ncbi:sigma-54-dependent Fis family transcriptional regulator [Alteromonas sp. C1M14]|uniref:sigma-54-dependent Fis family transcriptional regulator n=1 Tax=Alteromonas sp. C1M14 TaxID=2841567 RepID=UPI001C0971EF|nr:sigma-54-dependent Fis family transcriptional regulator [Alteromonas sp. C1M14]MBU2978482.1 sigma-54-dependent Fis family transcriptional regulator [Alteromonas sp. C1M14]
MNQTSGSMDSYGAQSFMSAEFRQRNIQPSDCIARSWKRSLLKYGLDPNKAGEIEVLSSSEMRQQLQQQEDYLNIARQGLTGLSKRIVDAGYSVVLTDETGLTLATNLPQGEKARSKESGLLIGARWAENMVGTNGIGTCLVEKESLIVHQDEHFYPSHKQLSCSVTPIFDPMGELRGCLNASCLGADKAKDNQFLTLQMVMMYGRMIENSYFRKTYRNQITLNIRPAESFFDLAQEQLLAVNERGVIIGANRSSFFEYSSLLPANQSLPGSKLEEIIGISIDELLTKTNGGSNVIKLYSPLLLEEIELALRVPGNKTFVLNKQTRPSAIAKKGSFGKHPSLEELSGNDPRMGKIVRQISQVLNKDIPVLITGETGTGKEAFARAIHQASGRANGPFVALNCAAIPETLIESELFGYRSGTFTGANKKGMTGKLELANGGTLFLDEIGDMPVQLQTRLLRVLAERESMPLGSSEPIALDLQIISATHQNLKERIEQKAFREDFYYRLNGMPVKLPALRDRTDKESIIASVIHRELKHEGEYTLTEQVLEILKQYHWPGNIRQLMSVLKYAAAVSENNEINVECLPDDVLENTSMPCDPPQEINAEETKAEHNPLSKYAGSHEGQLLLDTLKKHRWNITMVSEELNICRSTVYRKMKKFNIIQPNDVY